MAERRDEQEEGHARKYRNSDVTSKKTRNLFKPQEKNTLFEHSMRRRNAPVDAVEEGIC
jgi:hypothetical protein